MYVYVYVYVQYDKILLLSWNRSCFSHRFSSGPCEKLDILDAIVRVKADSTRLSSSHHFSEQSYLNLTSPVAPPDAKERPEDGARNTDDT